ncbi:hypothetical protein [Arthrobacter globiformis]|uniref:hypothetical protein n=1 Tax=Arthrobacter globiformis TaxID=1665 RepID=UPI0027D7D26A|nr:hypothetical protein [Arthrobacter globiformis]
MSAQKLADLCAEIGHPIPRDVISNLENGRRATVPITDLIVIAQALHVPALSLIFDPAAAGEEVERVPGAKCYLWEASDDFAGHRSAEFSGGRTFHEEAFATWKRTEVLRSLSKWEAAAFECVSDSEALKEVWEEQSRIEKLAQKRGVEPSSLDPWADQYQSDDEYQEQIGALEITAKRALNAILDHRQELQRLQVKVWPITDLLRSRYQALQSERNRGVTQ